MLQLLGNYSGTELLVVLVAYVLVLLLALSLHEFAHAYVATKQGDYTAKNQGRLTLNPFAHIDTLGFVLILFVGFGWAKPVPVNGINFRDYKKGMTYVALAGITMNFILAFVSYPLYLLSSMMTGTTLLALFLQTFFYLMVVINTVLIVFNLLPIYPLDGFRLVETHAKYGNKFVAFMRTNGPFVLLGVLLLLQFINVLQPLMNLIILPITLFWGIIF